MQPGRLINPVPYYSYNGSPAVGYKLHFLDPNTGAYKNIWTDATLGTTVTNPVVLNSQGIAPSDIYLNGSYTVSFGSPTDKTSDLDLRPVSPIWTRYNVLNSSQILRTVVTKTSNYTTLSTDIDSAIFLDTTSGNITLTLISAVTAGSGASFYVKKISTNNTATIAAAGGQTIDGGSTLTPFGSAVIISDGVNWYTVGHVVTNPELTAIAGLSSTGLIARTGTATYTTRTLTAPAAGISVSNGSGVSGNPTLALADDLAALETMSGTGVVTRTASNTYAQRTITAGTGITMTNGDGVGGNPTVTAITNLVKANRTTTTSYSSGAVIPYDSTIPQSTEGAQIFSQAISTLSGGNILEVTLIVPVFCSTADIATVSVFLDSASNAFATGSTTLSAGGQAMLTFTSYIAAGSTTPTIKVRLGSNGGGTVTQGAGGSGIFGGTMVATLLIKEYSS